MVWRYPQLPVSLHRLKHLELLSLQELPRLKNLPREYAELRPTLVDVGGLQGWRGSLLEWILVAVL